MSAQQKIQTEVALRPAALASPAQLQVEAAIPIAAQSVAPASPVEAQAEGVIIPQGNVMALEVPEPVEPLAELYECNKCHIHCPPMAIGIHCNGQQDVQCRACNICTS